MLKSAVRIPGNQVFVIHNFVQFLKLVKVCEIAFQFSINTIFNRIKQLLLLGIGKRIPNTE